MSKQTEKLKKQLIEISEVVNLFKSEAVQVKVLDRLLDVMVDAERNDADLPEVLSKKGFKYKSNGFELSGILLKLANEHKLRRERSETNNRFEYVKA
jgi:hypothetical protein